MRVLESALYAENLEETAAFYEAVLGLERIAAAPGRHVFFRSGDGVLLLFRPAATREPPGADARVPVPPHGTEGEGHLCFAGTAAEIERWRERLEAAGVGVEADFEWPQGGRSIYFRDPAGNSIEIAEPRIWGLEQ
jgi:catechol 2,3-dioxygenase-like lactoylglutathione lyase family enzyme